MTPFLRQVARHWAGSAELGNTMFVFPNRRSLVFFRHYLMLEAAGADAPFLAPPMLTINDFFCKATGRVASDRITLLARLYDCYRGLNANAESLDDFIGWGDVLLADFDDVDKYMVEARGLFTNVSDLKSMADDYSYLDEAQRRAVERLAGHLNASRTPDGAKRDVKDRFIRMWSILLPLYNSFRSRLDAAGEAYEGLIYRSLADRLGVESVADILHEALPEISSYVFVGLNALNECERTVLRKMHNARIASFAWDYTGPMTKAKGNGSTHFMERNLSDFPESFVPEPEGVGKPVIHVCGIPSAVGQARLLPQIVSGVPESCRGMDFAVVLGDETMLMSVLNSLPRCPEGVNVTMGYPLASSEFAALMDAVMELQMHLRNRNGGCAFYHRQVSDIFSSGLMKKAMNEDERVCAEDIAKAAKYYIPQDDFGNGPLLSAVFRPAGEHLPEYLVEVIEALAPYLDKLQCEFARHWYGIALRLKDMALDILPHTQAHLLRQLIAGDSVPFEGEPLGGLQVMGPLETRALDFCNLVIMGANEGVFPRSSISPSFVPPELRKAFGLPTYEYQEDVWAYYFYRMISRAENVWMLFDSRTEGLNTGEESRYVKHLRYLYPDKCVLERTVAKADITRSGEEDIIRKTPEAVEKIRNGVLSASSIQKYISCKASFYYSFIEELKSQDEVNESLDPGMLGDVLHGTMQALYCGEEAMKSDFPLDKRNKERQFPPLPEISRAYLTGWIARKDEIRDKVHRMIALKMKSPEVSGRDLVTADIIVRMVVKILQEDLRQLGPADSFSILGLEEPMTVSICGHQFFGYVDRIDRFGENAVRVVDYKTGGDRPEVLECNPSKVFSGSDTHKYKAALQFFIYDRMLENSKGTVDNSMYAMSDIFTNGVRTFRQSQAFNTEMSQLLSELLDEMEDLSVDFSRTSEKKRCTNCDFKLLCGRTSKR